MTSVELQILIGFNIFSVSNSDHVTTYCLAIFPGVASCFGWEGVRIHSQRKQETKTNNNTPVNLSKFFIYSGSVLSSRSSEFTGTPLCNKFNWLRIPSGRRQSCWLYTSAAEELSQGLPGTNAANGQGELGIFRFQVRHPEHSATIVSSFLFTKNINILFELWFLRLSPFLLSSLLICKFC